LLHQVNLLRVVDSALHLVNLLHLAIVVSTWLHLFHIALCLITSPASPRQQVVLHQVNLLHQVNHCIRSTCCIWSLWAKDSGHRNRLDASRQ